MSPATKQRIVKMMWWWVPLLKVSLCRMMFVESLKLEGYFHIHLLKVEGFFVAIQILILKGGPSSIICDITTGLAPIMVKYSTKTSMRWKLPATVNIDWQLTLQWHRRHVVSITKTFEIKYIYRFCNF